MSNETKIIMLEQRIHLLTIRGETMNRGIIAKCHRQIRKLQRQA